MERVIDRAYPRSVVLGDRQNDEPALQPDVVPLQSQYFTPAHPSGQGDHDRIPERMWWGRAAGQELMDLLQG